MSFPKLLTLGQIYGMKVEELIEQAPAEQRSRLWQSYHEWQASDRPMPDPSQPMPSLVEEKNRSLDQLISRKSKHVNIPLHAELGAKQAIRLLLTWSAIPPFLETEGRELPHHFWVSSRGARGTSRQREGDRVWSDIVHGFSFWLVYDQGQGEALLSMIDSWSLDFDTTVASCRFENADHNRAYGYDGALWEVIISIRWRQIACLLAEDVPDGVGTLPPPPKPWHAASEYMFVMTGMDFSGGVFRDLNHVALPDRIEAVSDMAAQLSSLRGSRKWISGPAHKEVIRLLQLAQQWPQREGRPDGQARKQPT